MEGRADGSLPALDKIAGEMPGISRLGHRQEKKRKEESPQDRAGRRVKLSAHLGPARSASTGPGRAAFSVTLLRIATAIVKPQAKGNVQRECL